jgi:hypothetical protein
MATASRTSSTMQEEVLRERWFFTGMASAMLAVGVAGFLPSIVDTAGRRRADFAAGHGAWNSVFRLAHHISGSEQAGRDRAGCTSPAGRRRRRFRPGIDGSTLVCDDCRNGSSRIRAWECRLANIWRN